MADSAALEDDLLETGLITRALSPTELEIRGDGRTVYGLVVPFNREAKIETRTGATFREVFRPGSFRQTINAGVNRVKLFENHGHLRGADPVGVATSLEETKRGVVGEFRIGKSPEGDAALQKVHDGILDAFSIGFRSVPGKSLRTKDLVEHTEANLKEVSLVSYPAYTDAAISGLRSQLLDLSDERLERLFSLSQITDEGLARLLAFATDLDTRDSEAADGTSVLEQSLVNEQDISHSSQETIALAVDLSHAARQHRARQIEARRKGFGKRI